MTAFRLFNPAALALAFALLAAPLHAQGADRQGAPPPAATGWLNWRGPAQNGASTETGLPDSLEGDNLLWTADLAGKSTPVIANGKLYIMGYHGDGPELQEAVVCFNAETGQKIWEHGYTDFLSDTIYRRYAT